ncbi:MAG TPA: AsmA family protein [Terriglobia bacterium]|nr:AsmA family protein [Terriglobia bacterium]
MHLRPHLNRVAWCRIEGAEKPLTSCHPHNKGATSISRRKKVILGILIFLVVTLVALAVIVPRLLDVDRYRPQVVGLIEKQMGKPTEIGHLTLTVFPRLSIRVDDFTLRNPAGFPQGYFVRAGRIYAVVDVGGLWDHQVVIKSLELERPAISLLSDLKGNWNFDSYHSPSQPAPDPPGDLPGEKPLFTLGVISNVKVSKGKLSVANLLPSGQAGPVFIEADGVSGQLRKVDLNALTENGQSEIPRFARNDSERPGTTAPEISQPPANASWLWSVAYTANPSGTLVAEGTFETDTLHLINIVVTNVKSKLCLFPKQVFLDRLEFKCYDGGAGGDLFFAFAGPNPRYSIHAKLSSVNVAKLLGAFPDARGRLTGTLDGTLELNGEVSHSPDALAAVGGSGSATIRNGRLPTLQLNKDLLQLARVAKMGPASGDPASFSSIAMDFTVTNNRINTTKATIVGNGVDIDASGSLSLAGKGSLDYQGVARVATSQNALTNILGQLTGASLKGGKMAFPFHLTGTFKNPIFTLNSGRSNP